MGKCAVGGTFEILHRGHRTLLARAFQECGEVLIGLTTDEFANRSRKRRVRPYEQREREICEFIDEEFEGRRYKVVPISDELGPAATQADIEALVVSVDSYRNGKKVNEVRERNGLPSLRIIKIPHVLADDGTRISSTKVLSGVCDPDGHRIDDLD